MANKVLKTIEIKSFEVPALIKILESSDGIKGITDFNLALAVIENVRRLKDKLNELVKQAESLKEDEIEEFNLKTNSIEVVSCDVEVLRDQKLTLETISQLSFMLNME